jgi:Ser-tRNA(Ala) deacylase AlaX
MQRTYLAFQRNAHLLKLQVTVTAVRTLASLEEANRALFIKPGSGADEDQHHVVVTDSTIFHPQGGGQPSDVGCMTGAGGARFDVEMVRTSAAASGEVLHFGRFAASSPPFRAGEAVEQSVDAEKRLLYSRYHTAGHVLGSAVRHLVEKEVAGFDETKASHFPDSAACEFSGSIEGRWKDVIQAKVDEYVERDMPVEIDWWDEDEFRRRGLARLIPEDKSVLGGGSDKYRVVHIVGAEAYPCGGTHVDTTDLCGATTVKKIARSKGKSRVSYTVA